MLKAVIYDLDGLMVDSEPLNREASDILLKRYGHKYSDLPESVKVGFFGKREIDFLKAVIEHLNLKVSLAEFLRKELEIFLKLAKEKLQPMPGLFKSLDLLKRNNFKLGLASSAPQRGIDFILEKFKIQNYFDAIVSGDEVKTGKPNPQIYLLACQKLNLRPKECLALEDAENGIESAKKAGCKCIAVKNPHIPPQNYSKADLVLNSLEELTLDVITNRLNSV